MIALQQLLLHAGKLQKITGWQNRCVTIGRILPDVLHLFLLFARNGLINGEQDEDAG
jgi:hypothetical protein